MKYQSKNLSLSKRNEMMRKVENPEEWLWPQPWRWSCFFLKYIMNQRRVCCGGILLPLFSISCRRTKIFLAPVGVDWNQETKRPTLCAVKIDSYIAYCKMLYQRNSGCYYVDAVLRCYLALMTMKADDWTVIIRHLSITSDPSSSKWNSCESYGIFVPHVSLSRLLCS